MGLAPKDLRLRFIIFQLIQTIRFVHARSLCFDELSPTSIEVDNDLWATFRLQWSSRLMASDERRRALSRRPSNNQRSLPFIPISPLLGSGPVVDVYDSDDEFDPYVLAQVDFDTKKTRPMDLLDASLMKERYADEAVHHASAKLDSIVAASRRSVIDRPPGYDVPLTVQWIEGKISNFEYIMAINAAAGRQLSDVQHHPVLPWVTNFSVDPTQGVYDASALRDLTKTKFRLSKGDRQLETTFQHSEPPHHVPEILAELTYTIYIARRAPMHVLQRVVRSYFVPEHYPHSMARMYEWSPDECIPEFYMDPSVFESIHKDVGLNDIELPEFAPTPSEFIRYHRSILESNHVSTHLHTWIDLTFGCFLTGQNAIDNLNVPLQHAINPRESCGGPPDLLKHPGFVVLFDRPHPRRMVAAETPDGGPGLSEDNVASAASSRKSGAFAVDTDKESIKKSMLLFSSLKSDPVDFSIPNLSSSAPPGTPAERSASGTEFGSGLFPSAAASPALLSSSPLAGAGGSLFDGGIARQDKFSVAPSLIQNDPDNSSAILKYAGSIRIQTDTDERVMKQLLSSRHRVDALQFAHKYSAELEPAYTIPLSSARPVGSSNAEGEEEGAPVETSTAEAAPRRFDSTFFCRLTDLEASVASAWADAFAQSSGSSSKPLSAAALDRLQQTDMQSLGLIIAYMYSGAPMFSASEARRHAGADHSSVSATVLSQLYGNTELSAAPLVVKRLISLLLSGDERARPSANEILISCMMADKSSSREEESFLSPPIVFRDAESDIEAQWNKRSSILRCDFLKDNCGYLFPSYFATAFTFISKLKCASSGSLRIRNLIANLDVLDSLPLDGISLVLPHVLACLRDPEPFLQDSALGSGDLEGGTADSPRQTAQLISEYHKIFDALAARLGVFSTEVIIIPHVVAFLENLRSPDLLRRLILGYLPQVLLKRAGARCFFRLFLPQLVTWMISGNLLILLKNRRKSFYQSGHLPLWASQDVDSFEVSEWLIHTATQAQIQDVQEAAVAAIVALSATAALGPALSLRFVLPAVLCLIGNPSLAVAGYYAEPLAFQSRRFEISSVDRQRNDPAESDMHDDLQGSESNGIASIADTPIEELNEIIDSLATYDEQHMYAVRALESMCLQAGIMPTVELVLPYLLQNILPSVENLVSTSPVVSASANACILEIAHTVLSILPLLSPAIVVNSFFVRQKSGSCLLNLLLAVPIPRCSVLLKKSTSVADDVTAASVPPTSREFNDLVQFFRSYRAFIELCRLITALSSHVGSALTLEHVIPVVDKFFGVFVSSFSALPVMSAAMSHAFNIGVQLFIPLVQLIGPEAFSTAASNLNPRLEMWLMSTASGVLGRSPPLPSNILPEVVSESERKLESREGRLTRFMQWLSAPAQSPSQAKRDKPASVAGPTGTADGNQK
jgi:hypothetical protein